MTWKKLLEQSKASHTAWTPNIALPVHTHYIHTFFVYSFFVETSGTGYFAGAVRARTTQNAFGVDIRYVPKVTWAFQPSSSPTQTAVVVAATAAAAGETRKANDGDCHRFVQKETFSIKHPLCLLLASTKVSLMRF